MKCKNCDKELLNNDLKYCPFCQMPLYDEKIDKASELEDKKVFKYILVFIIGLFIYYFINPILGIISLLTTIIFAKRKFPKNRAVRILFYFTLIFTCYVLFAILVEIFKNNIKFKF